MKKIMKKVMIGAVLMIIALVMLCSCEDNNYSAVQPECPINCPLVTDYCDWVIMCKNDGKGHPAAVAPWDIEKRLEADWKIATCECLPLE